MNDLKRIKENRKTNRRANGSTTKKNRNPEESGLRMLEQDEKTGLTNSFLLGYN